MVVKDVDYVMIGCFIWGFEMFVIVKVEDIVVVWMWVFCNDCWEVEYYSIDVDKVNEIEFIVYDKFGEYLMFIGMLWVWILDIVEEMCCKRIEVEMNSFGWVFVDRMGSIGSGVLV